MDKLNTRNKFIILALILSAISIFAVKVTASDYKSESTYKIAQTDDESTIDTSDMDEDSTSTESSSQGTDEDVIIEE